MKFIIITTFVIFSHLFYPSTSKYLRHLRHVMKYKFWYMNEDLISDALRKVEALNFLTVMYGNSTGYQLGQFMYDIRNTFKLMLIKYKESQTEAKDPTHHQVVYNNTLHVEYLKLEILNLLAAIEDYEHKFETKNDAKANTDFVLRKKKNKGTVSKPSNALRSDMNKIRHGDASKFKSPINGDAGFDSEERGK